MPKKNRVDVELEEEEETTACPPRLCKDGYSTSPSIETLGGLPGRELAAILDSWRSICAVGA